MKYEIKGDSLPVVICSLDANESIITEGGSMSWMSSNMKMETVGGGAKKVFGRMFTGESLFLNRYTAEGGPGMIAMASSFPGKILPVEIAPGQELVVQKSGFLGGETTVELSTFFQKKIGAGFFGGEGFILQKLSGNGIAFIEIDGHCEKYTLAAGEQLILDTGYLAAMSATCTIDIQAIKGVKNVFLGGEGLFNTVISGPRRRICSDDPDQQTGRCIKTVLPK